VAVGGRAIDDLARLARSPYLLGIADLASNIFALLMQTLLVGWLTTRGGVRATLTAMWGVAAVSFAILALFPGGALLLITQVVRRGGDYGLFKPAREMLFTVLSPEGKFKSKSLLDTCFSAAPTVSATGCTRWSPASGLRPSRASARRHVSC
jgi:AAA family ATP:ADP antiporter